MYTHGIPVGKFNEISVGVCRSTHVLSVSTFHPRGGDDFIGKIITDESKRILHDTVRNL